MKKIYILFLASFCQLILTDSKAQFIKYEDDSGWKMGFNLSGNWQQSDMKAKAGLGFGFTLGNALSQKPGKFFAWDWAYRYQAGWNYGYDVNRDTNFVTGPFGGNNTTSPELNFYKDSLGFIHRNYRVNVQEHNLELILTLNKLRERTGIVLYAWGGLGFVGYKVNTNQIDEFGFSGGTYNYSNLDSGAVTQADLNFLWDNTYETNALNNENTREWKILPSAGIGLGYQFSPYFTMGWEHKVTFAMNDYIDGKISSVENHSGGTPTNDRFHYTGIYFRFHLMRATGYVNNNNNNYNYNYNTNTNTNTNTTTNITNTTPVEKPRPIVDFTNPTPSYVTVNNQVYNVMANVYNVDNSSNITFKHNGIESTSFAYSTISKEFQSQVILQPGNNIFEIRAVNSEGYDYESRIVIYEIPFVSTAIPPVVTITNPPYSPYNSSSNTFNVTATILNIDNYSAITHKVNGVLNNGFTYNVTTKSFSNLITLNQGNNTIEIKATNAAGQDVKYATIVYQPVQVQLPPVVTITNPALNPYTVSVNSTTVEASVLNVASANDITLRINGALTSAFTYNASTKQMVIVSNLVEGANIFEITGTNAVGADSKNTTIIYVKPQTELPPVVTYVDPTNNPHSITVNSKLVKATVLNVAAASNITITLNGNPVTNFNFNSATKLISFTASNLAFGSNVVNITGTNNVGTDTEATTIIYEKPNVNPLPIVTITNPAQNPYNSSVANVTIVASILHVNGASDVTFKLNGTLNSNFSYDPTTDIFTSNITLLDGNNTIEIKGINTVGSDTETATLIYTKPCDIPTFSLLQPSSSTYNTSINTQIILVVANHVNNQSQIDLKVNGVVSSFSFDPATHVITATANLVDGDNNVTITANTSCGTAVLPMNIRYTRPVQPPVVTITDPSTNPYTTTNATHNVFATIQYVSSASNITFRINGVASSNFTFNSSSTQFQSNVSLIAGANVIEITGTNNDGVDSKTTTIIYQAPTAVCLNPVIALSTPSGNNTVSTIGNVGVIALIQNISANSNIVFKQNGTVKTTTYDLATGLMNAGITLSDGNNNFEIIATNDCGVTNYNFSITYNRPLVPPVVTITIPSQNPYTSLTANTIINATVLHVNSSSNITFTINGTPSTGFTYNSNTSQFVSNSITLNTGNNTFVITGTNNDGTDSESTVIIYQPCLAPDVTILENALNTNTNNNATSPFSFSATTTNVTISNELSLTQNGVQIPFIFSNGNVTATINLVNGSNVIVLTATNACGTDSETKTVPYQGCLAPLIVFGHPGTTGTIETTAPYLFEAALTNMPNNGTIILKHNGNTVSGSNFLNGTLSASITLVPGLNTFLLKVINPCGTATETTSVTLQQCNVPNVTISSPSNGSTVTTNSVNVSASITNVADVSDIQATVNNTTVVGSFSNGNYSFTANLVDGANVISISAQTDCGSDAQTVTVNANLVVTPPVDPMITICHTPPGNPNNKQTLTIPQSAWAAHEAHGDVLGECVEVVPPVDPMITICHTPPGNPNNKQTLTIPQSAWAAHEAHGDVLGECLEVVPPVDPMITICHTPPGNPNNTQTLTIPQSAWAAHEAHGDVLGECVEVPPTDPEITICHHQGNSGNTQTMTILQSQWASHQAHGDELGECAPVIEEKKIKICHIPPGNEGNPQTIEIPESAWAAHEAHGDVLGECVDSGNGNGNGNGNGKSGDSSEEDAKKKAAEVEAKRKAEAKLKAEEDAKKKAAEEESRRKAKEEADKKAGDAKLKADETKRKAAEEEAKRKAQEDANKRAAEVEAKRKADEEASKKAKEEADRNEAENESKRKAENEAKLKIERENKLKSEEEKKKKEEESKKAEENTKTEENKKEEEDKKTGPKVGIKPR